MNRIRIKDWVYSRLGLIVPASVPEDLVFVVGTGRCGTTLMMRILDTNPEVRILEGELNTLFHQDLYPYPKELTGTVPSMKQDPRQFTAYSLRNWKRNAKWIERRLKTESLLASGKTLVVKSAMVSLMINEINSAFPQAKIIHLYRHAVPVVNSWIVKDFKKKHLPFTSETEMALAAAHYWCACINGILEAASRGINIHHLSYEQLVADPRPTIEALSREMGISTSYNFEFEQVEDRNRGYRFREGLPAEEIIKIVNPVLPKLGYEPMSTAFFK